MRRFARRLKIKLPGLLVRFIIVLLGFVLFGLVLFVLWLQASICMTTTTGAVSAATTITAPVSLVPTATTMAASPSPTATPTLLDKITNCTDNMNKALTSLLLGIVNLLTISIIIALALFLIWRFWRLSHVSNLVIETFNNATGNSDLDKALPGLNQLTREKLVPAVDGIRLRIIKYKVKGPSEYDPPVQNPPPETNADQRLTDFITSLKGVAPAGPLQTAIQLLGQVFTPRGIKVSTTLQSRGETPRIFGISFEVMDLQGQQEPKLLTFWEPSQSSKIVTSSQQAITSSPSASTPDTVSDKNKKSSVSWLHSFISLLKIFKQHSPDSSQQAQMISITAKQSKSPEDHFLALLEPATRWLAIELARRSMEAQIPRIGQRKIKRYCSRMYNFIGAFYQTSAFTFYEYPTFYMLAIDYFNQAIKKDEEWFQPYKNLADTYLMQVIGLRSKHGNDDKGLLYLAISQYDVAWKLYSSKVLTAFHRRTVNSFAPIKPENEQKSRHTRATIMRSFLIGKATAQLLTGDDSLIIKAKAIIVQLLANEKAMQGLIKKITGGKTLEPLGKEGVVAELIEKIREIETTWKIDEEKDGGILHDLAAWLGIAQRSCSNDIKRDARLYLTYCLVRDDNLWFLAESDSSFVDIFTLDDFKALKTAVREKLCEIPQLPKEVGPVFNRYIEEILSKVVVGTQSIAT